MRNNNDINERPALGESPFFGAAYAFVEHRCWPAIWHMAVNDRMEIAFNKNHDRVQELAESAAQKKTGKTMGPDFEQALNETFEAEMQKVYDAVNLGGYGPEDERQEDAAMKKCRERACDYYIRKEAIEAEIFRLENAEYAAGSDEYNA